MDKQYALDWAGQYLDIQHCDSVTDRPWGKIYRIKHAKGRAYLKMLPPVLASATTTTSLLSAAFPKTIPGTIATDDAHGLILFAEHEGRDLTRDISETQRTQMLTAYATLQSRCANEHQVLNKIPSLDVSTLIDQLTQFLSPAERPTQTDDSVVHADYFLSTSRCKSYASHFELRADLLRRFLDKTENLRPTINHCDLRPSNAAVNKHGEIILYDWDEAVAGPAGLSLHAMFSGCIKVVHVLNDDPGFIDPEELRQPRRELDAYIDTLVTDGYANREILVDNLSAAVIAGMIKYIVSFRHFPHDSDRYKRTIRKNLTRRLSDLLDVCDYLSARDDAEIYTFAEDYVLNRRDWRAERLLKLYLHYRPDDATAHHRLGNLLLSRNARSRAIRAFEASLEISPDNPDAHIGLGTALARRCEYRPAISHLRRALAQPKADSAQAIYLQRLHELENAYVDSGRPGIVPTVAFSASERSNSKITLETLALCETLFRKYGVLQLNNVFDSTLLNTCHDDFLQRYQTYISGSRHKDALRIGDKRFQVTIDIEPPYNNPELYGSGLILPLMERLVGDTFILGCFTSSMSLPGSEDQRLHKDHKALFAGDPEAGTIPSYAVTMMVPLVDLNETVGTTRVKKGTHRLTTGESKPLPYQTPLAKVGSCYLMDYRLSHHGQANRSKAPRPILSLVYQRPWFHDYINFKNQPSLRISNKELQNVPEKLKRLLDWSNDPSPNQLKADAS